MQKANDGTRSLFESIMPPEIIAALEEWKKAKIPAVLIGGLALSYYIKPRMTQDIDYLFLKATDIPAQVVGFRRTRDHAFEHIVTHVEVEIIVPEFVNIPQETVAKVIETAVESDGIHVASPAGLVALKLFRLSPQDKVDIMSLINYTIIELAGFHLPVDKLEKFSTLVVDAEVEKKRQDMHKNGG